MYHFFNKIIKKNLDSDSLTLGVVSKLNQNFDYIKGWPVNCDFLIMYIILIKTQSVKVGNRSVIGKNSYCPNLTFLR